MRVLVLGALGFIGRQVVAALLDAGHSVRAAVRAGREGELPQGIEAVACDLQRDLEPASWLPRLQGIDAVVNAAGLLKADPATLEAVHRHAPLALARAAEECSVRVLVQISALGDPADGAFIASKHRADAALLECGLAVTVLRPGLVYSLAGSYGGNSLLRALAALPGVLPLPGNGQQPIQPLHVRDLAAMVVAALAEDAPRGVLLLGGPERIGIGAFLASLRRWLRLPPAFALPLPLLLLRPLAAIADRLGDGPMGLTLLRMLKRGVAADPGQVADAQERLGVSARPLRWWMQQEPSQEQDRWHARLYPLAPLLRLTLGAMALISASAGFAQTPAQISVLAAPLGWPEWLAWLAGYGGSTLDALLGAMLLANWRARLAGHLLLWLVLAYTLLLGFGMPGLWLDPWGALAKNLVILPAILTWLVLARRG